MSHELCHLGLKKTSVPPFSIFQECVWLSSQPFLSRTAISYWSSTRAGVCRNHRGNFSRMLTPRFRNARKFSVVFLLFSRLGEGTQTLQAFVSSSAYTVECPSGCSHPQECLSGCSCCESVFLVALWLPFSNPLRPSWKLSFQTELLNCVQARAGLW